MVPFSKRFCLSFTLFICIFVVLSSIHPESPVNRRIQQSFHSSPSETRPDPFKHTKIYVASAFAAHFDVYLVLAGTIDRILNNTLGLDYDLHVYVSLPMRYRFQEIIDLGKTGLYEGPIKHNGDFLDDFEAAYERGEDPTLLVLGTCEVDMPDWSNRLLKLWDSLSSSRRFRVLCGIHNTGNNEWPNNELLQWSKRGAISVYGISEHVANSFLTRTASMADMSDPNYYAADLQHIKAYSFVPILDLHTKKSHSTLPLRNAVIQGNFELARRDYKSLFSDLLSSITADPAAWGYSPSLEPIEELHPFVLHLMGNGKVEDLKIPDQLKAHVVKIWKDLDYPEYYEKIRNMDVVVPAFSWDGGYYEKQASSTVVMAVECHTPILSTDRLLSSYTYLSPALTINRPQALREIHALKLLRPSATSSHDDVGGTLPSEEMAPALWNEAREMVSNGWRKDNLEVQKALGNIWMKNEQTAMRILREL